MEKLCNMKFARYSILLLFSVIFLLGLKVICYANPSYKPFIIIVVDHAPKDLEISFEERFIFSRMNKIGTETQFLFYTDMLQKNKEYHIFVKTNGNVTQYTMDDLKYRNIYTLDIKNNTLLDGTTPLRYVRLVLIYICLTIFLEGIIFFAFGFRKKKSWITFVMINIITQGVLHLWTDSPNLFNQWLFSDDGIIFGLISGEMIVFLLEFFCFGFFTREKRISQRLAYVFVANLFSLVVGWFVLVGMPI